MAQTETDWRREQGKALQSDNDLEIKEPEWATQEYMTANGYKIPNRRTQTRRVLLKFGDFDGSL